ncbi:unnamed protein product [Chrysoparadoxa australica]
MKTFSLIAVLAILGQGRSAQVSLRGQEAEPAPVCSAVSAGTIYRSKPAVQCDVPGFKVAKWFQCPTSEACTCDDLAPLDVNAEFSGDTVTCSCDAATSMVALANERDCPCGPCLDSCNTCYPKGCDNPARRLETVRRLDDSVTHLAPSTQSQTVTCYCNCNASGNILPSAVVNSDTRNCACGPCLDTCNTCYPNGCDSPTN